MSTRRSASGQAGTSTPTPTAVRGDVDARTPTQPAATATPTQNFTPTQPAATATPTTRRRQPDRPRRDANQNVTPTQPAATATPTTTSTPTQPAATATPYDGRQRSRQRLQRLPGLDSNPAGRDCNADQDVDANPGAANGNADADVDADGCSHDRHRTDQSGGVPSIAEPVAGRRDIIVRFDRGHDGLRHFDRANRSGP